MRALGFTANKMASRNERKIRYVMFCCGQNEVVIFSLVTGITSLS